MITNASLKSSTVKDLGELAKSHGLFGWHSMKKEQLVQALLKLTRKSTGKTAVKRLETRKVNDIAKPKPSVPVAAKKRFASTGRGAENGKPTTRGSAPSKVTVSSRGRSANMKPTAAKLITSKVPARNGVSHAASNGSNGSSKQSGEKTTRRIHAAHEKKERFKDLSGRTNAARSNGDASKGADRDRIVLLVRDSYWLHVMWQVARTTVVRAQAAMAEHWHTAKPILRLMEVDAGPTTSTAERVIREIEVHGGVQNWYIDVQNPPHSYRVDLGYRSTTGKFFSVARSNMVTTPPPDSSDSIDENWKAVAQDYEKIYALSGGYNEERSSGELQELFEERLRRPMGPDAAKYGIGAERLINRHKGFLFDIDAEIIVFGTTSPDARVTLGGEPVKLRSDGTFTVRLAMPDKRQVIPAVAASADGVEQRTVVLAVERNTKVLEPMVKEQNDS